MKLLARIISGLIVIASLLLWVAPARADTGTYFVQPGETLFRIAPTHGVSIEALRAANGITGSTIYSGQTLAIPTGADSTITISSDTPSPLTTANGTHVAQGGENLFRIGLKYGVSIAALQTANGTAGNTIYVGQPLIIPNDPPGEAAPVIESSAVAETALRPVPARSPVIAPPADNGKRFIVDLSEQRLYAYEGDTLVRATLVSTGLPATLTVSGTFCSYLRYLAQRMTGPGPDLPGVPYVQYFYKEYGLHGMDWLNNFGQPMSHGCVNLPTPEAEWAYTWADFGTPVIVQP